MFHALGHFGPASSRYRRHELSLVRVSKAGRSSMSGATMLVHLGGAVALLLYATRMVRTGVERASGPLLRRILQQTLSSPASAAFVGLLLAIAFQSATAVNLLLASLAGNGLIAGAAALTGALGADLGSALVVRLLTLDLSLVMPLALMAGTTIFLSTERKVWRQAGRILIGVGLLLLSLQLIGHASEPLRESSFLPLVIGFLADDSVTAFLVAAIFAWLFHSSVAFILLIVALAAATSWRMRNAGMTAVCRSARKAGRNWSTCMRCWSRTRVWPST